MLTDSRISQGIKAYDPIVRMGFQHVEDKVAAYEARTTCYNYVRHSSLPSARYLKSASLSASNGAFRSFSDKIGSSTPNQHLSQDHHNVFPGHFRRIVFIHLVVNFHIVRQGNKSMGKSLGYKQLSFVFFCQFDCYPFLYVGDPFLMSTATSRISPLVHLTSLVCAIGGCWK